MAKVIVSNKNHFIAKFTESELRVFGPVVGSTEKWNKRIFVNWQLPLLTWSGHDIRCVEDVLDMIKKIGNWQGKLQDKQPRFNAHAPDRTILRDNGLTDQKVRIPVFGKQSAPYVQWVRDDTGSRWLIHGYSFNDDLPSVSAYFAAVTKLKEHYLAINKTE